MDNDYKAIEDRAFEDRAVEDRVKGKGIELPSIHATAQQARQEEKDFVEFEGRDLSERRVDVEDMEIELPEQEDDEEESQTLPDI